MLNGFNWIGALKRNICPQAFLPPFNRIIYLNQLGVCAVITVATLWTTKSQRSEGM